MDDKQTPTGDVDDPEDRPSEGGVLGGSTPQEDTSESDRVPQDEVTPGKPSREGI